MELYQVFLYNFLCQNVLIFPICIYFSQKELKHFGLEKLVYGILKHFEIQQVFMYNFSVLNRFKYFLIYILRQNVTKNQTRKFLNYIKSLRAKFFKILSNTFFEIKCFKIRQQTILILHV